MIPVKESLQDNQEEVKLKTQTPHGRQDSLRECFLHGFFHCFALQWSKETVTLSQEDNLHLLLLYFLIRINEKNNWKKDSEAPRPPR